MACYQGTKIGPNSVECHFSCQLPKGKNQAAKSLALMSVSSELLGNVNYSSCYNQERIGQHLDHNSLFFKNSKIKADIVAK